MAATRPHRIYPREVFGFVRKKYASGLDPETIKTRVFDVYREDIPLTTIKEWRPGGSYDWTRSYSKRGDVKAYFSEHQRKRMKDPELRKRKLEQQKKYNQKPETKERVKRYEISALRRPWVRYALHWVETGEPYGNSRVSYRREERIKYLHYLALLERLMPAAISVLGPLTQGDIHAEIKKATGVSFSDPVIPTRLKYLTEAKVLRYDEQTGKYGINPDSTYARLAVRSRAFKNLFKPSEP